MTNQGVNLPDGYVRLNYVEATGQQWVNTGAIFNSSTQPSRIDIRFQFTELKTLSVVFGRAENTNNSRLFYFGQDEHSSYLFARIGKTGSAVRFGQPDTNIHDFCFSFGEGVFIDNVLAPETITEASKEYSSSSTAKTGFFTRNRGSTPDSNTYMIGRIYSAKFYTNGELDYNFVPAQKIDTGEIGFFETQRQEFLASATDTPLLGG